MYIYSCFLFLFSYLMWPLPLNASWAQLGYVLKEFEDATQCTKPIPIFINNIVDHQQPNLNYESANVILFC